IRIGTPAITTRGFMKNEMNLIVKMIDKVLNNHKNMSVISKVADEVKEIMKERKLFNF
ncbi:MAG: serine hydroxymethyltransferase, partial [Flavobacteriaceae bacterium]|nr:serine hydroxymethyltransferase [Flavobacteriaceae bacterium]